TEIANQANLDVVINSSDPDYNDDTDFTDGPAAVVADPCYNHPSDAADPISPGGGQWTDVRVKERNLPSLFGAVGLPLSRTGARARVEIRPALSGHRFLPLAVPDNMIEKVQVRYYNECTGAEIAKADLGPLGALPAPAGGTLWAIADAQGQGDASIGLNLPMPQYDPSCGDYMPVGVEVRLASQADVDLNQSCAQLAAARYADCFHRLSQIRVWNDGNADSQPRLTNVRVMDGCGAPADGYFGRLPFLASNCRYTVSAEVNWGSRDDGDLNDMSNFEVTANGVQLNPPSGSPSGVWTSNPNAVTYAAGANTVTIGLDWVDNDTTHNWNGACKNGNQNPCKYSGTQPAHRAFVGTKANSGAVVLVNTSANMVSGGLPGTPFDNHRSGGAPLDCNDGDDCLIYPTVGTESVLTAGVLTTLRLDDPQANQTLRCDPNYAQGQEFSTFRYGCEPWYAANTWNSPWWVNKQCPDPGLWFSYATMPAPFGQNGRTNAWQCVLTAPGMSVGQVGDDIAVATDNCNTINNNSCQQFACNYDGNYDGKGSTPGWNTTGGKGGNNPPNPEKLGSAYPRVVNLFIVPYQGSKGLTGAGDTIPVLGFASFYVMNWTGANNNQSDPCPDTTWGNVSVPDPPKGAITGVFVEAVDYEPGPVDKTATCTEGMLRPCRATLVR
ncbi:MAG: hypothetical protein M5U27_17465, partial [Gaiella sp.]|nr:hypothetical protein [Gaiella sp.]